MLISIYGFQYVWISICVDLNMWTSVCWSHCVDSRWSRCVDLSRSSVCWFSICHLLLPSAASLPFITKVVFLLFAALKRRGQYATSDKAPARVHWAESQTWITGLNLPGSWVSPLWPEVITKHWAKRSSTTSPLHWVLLYAEFSFAFSLTFALHRLLPWACLLQTREIVCMTRDL